MFTPNSTNGYMAAVPSTTLDLALVDYLSKEGYVKVRPLVVFPSYTDRTIIC